MKENINNTEAKSGATKKYRTILADPPWGVSAQRGKNSVRSAESYYELMPLERIKAMPVQDLVEENSHLYLWIPNALLREGLDVIEAWGFTFRGPIYWIKPRLLLGNYYRNASETCLFATRGKAPVKFHGQPNWMFCPQQRHSQKPEEQYAVIRRMSYKRYLRYRGLILTVGDTKRRMVRLSCLAATPYQNTVPKRSGRRCDAYWNQRTLSTKYSKQPSCWRSAPTS